MNGKLKPHRQTTGPDGLLRMTNMNDHPQQYCPRDYQEGPAPLRRLPNNNVQTEVNPATILITKCRQVRHNTTSHPWDCRPVTQRRTNYSIGCTMHYLVASREAINNSRVLSAVNCVSSTAAAYPCAIASAQAPSLSKPCKISN